MHIWMCIAIPISDICSDQSCIVYDTNRRPSRGNCLIWDSMPSVGPAVLIPQVAVPFPRTEYTLREDQGHDDRARSSMLPSSSCNRTWITSRSSNILEATCQATATQSRTYVPGPENLHPFSNCFVLYCHQLPST